VRRLGPPTWISGDGSRPCRPELLDHDVAGLTLDHALHVMDDMSRPDDEARRNEPDPLVLGGIPIASVQSMAGHSHRNWVYSLAAIVRIRSLISRNGENLIGVRPDQPCEREGTNKAPLGVGT
jgi:hypothetical protein